MNRRRLLALPLAAVLFLLVAHTAHAGSYTVRACASDGVNNAFWGFANGGLTAYSRCPGTDYDGQGTGIVARAVPGGNGGWVGNGASAWQIFEAPPGAALQSMTFNASTGRSTGCWSVGVFAWSGDAFHPGRHLWGQGANCNLHGGGFAFFNGPHAVDLGGHQKVRVGVRCDGGSCPTGGSVATWANVKDVTVTVRDDSAPGIAARAGALWRDGWHRGVEEAWAAYGDNVGIRHIYGELAGERFSFHDFAGGGWPASLACDFFRPRPCQDIPNGGLGIDTARVPDGRHVLRVVAVDAAGNHGSVDRLVSVDNHAPVPPRNVTVGGGEGWRRENRFDVSWTNPPGQVAPIVRAHWRLCRGADPGSCQAASASGPGIDRVEGLRPVGAGDWVLSVWLEDEAGNSSERLASQPVHLRLDDVAPETPGFDPLDPADPRRVALPVSDRHSGVAAASIQMRTRPAGAWRELPTTLEASGRASARIPDLELPDGSYELRALVRDHAGNETLADRDALGRAMTLVLPLRLATRIVADAAPRARPRCRTIRRRVRRRTVSRRVCRRAPVAPPATSARPPLRVPFGRTARLAGVLETWQGRPVGGGVIDVHARRRTEPTWRRAGTVRAGASGRFAYRVPAGASRTLRLTYGGDDVLLPSSLEVRVLVPAGGTLRASRRRARNGGGVAFTGRLVGRPLPRGGRTVDLQAYYRGAWRTFATPRTDAGGRWRHPYRFGATTGRVVYRFRGLIKRDAAYPYEQSATPTVRVTVTG